MYEVVYTGQFKKSLLELILIDTGSHSDLFG